MILSEFMPILGIDIGGTISKLSFALKKGSTPPPQIQYIPRLKSRNSSFINQLQPSMNLISSSLAFPQNR